MDQLVEKISRSNKALNILLNFNRKILHFTSENDIAKEVCRIAVEELECDSAWFSYSSDTSGKACIPVVSYEEKSTQKDDTNKNDSETKTHKPVNVPNYPYEMLYESWNKETRDDDLLSTIVLPVTCGTQTIGVFCVSVKGSHEKYLFDDNNLLEELVKDLGRGISQLRLNKKNMKNRKYLFGNCKGGTGITFALTLPT